jgi:O-antigen ligase
VLPFEPLRPVLPAFSLEFTLLELAAAAATAAILVARWPQAVLLLRRPPRTLAFLAAFAAAHLLSAAFAPAYGGPAAKFALRMVAAAVFALAVAASTVRARRAALAALAVSALLVALLALGEGLGGAVLDPVLDAFRERVYSIGENRRASGGSGGPNQAAAFLAAGLVAGAGVLAARARLAIGFAALVSLGLLFTYSRGGLAAAFVGLVVLAWARPGSRRVALGCAAAVAALAVGFLVHPRFRERLATEVTERLFAARYEPADAALRLAPGEVRSVEVELVNTGRSEWAPEMRPTLHAFLHEWPAREPLAVWRRPLAAAVPVGGRERVAIAIRAPTRPGTYLLVWNLFTLPSGFLSASGTVPALVPVGVGVAPPPTVALEPRTWRRGRVELWTLALAMWRDHPLLGVGADNFRRLHPRYGGWLAAGNYPMSAHNQILETVATTGLVGLLALLGTLAFAGLAARRALGGSEGAAAAVVLALLAAWLVQAQVEALLEFTGHYLLFAFVVGAAAAMERDPA